MSRLDDVFAALHDLILERFRMTRGGDAGKAFVAFEFGTPIPRGTFCLRDQDQSLSPELAVEFMSQHANTVPDVRDMLFRRRPYSIAAQYGLMLAGATPVDASGMEMIGGVKREAAADYDHTLGSLIGPYRYRPVYATPVNWYDETQSGNWTHVAIDRTDTPPSRPQSAPAINPALRMWRIAPQALQPALDHAVSTQTIRQLQIAPALEEMAVMKPSRAQVRMAGRTDVSRMMLRSQPLFTQSVTTLSESAITRRAISPAFAARRTVGKFSALAGAHVTPPTPDPAPVVPAKTNIASLLAVNASWQLAKAIETDAKQQDVTTDQFGISVDICLVTLNRPWLSDGFLSLPGWFVPGFEKGEFSEGDEEEDGPFAMLPTACILIRNLDITANWSEGDHAAIEQSSNLGGFNLFGRSFDRNTATVKVPGMQSIAWVCEPMPVLPPAGAPQV